MCPGSGEGQNWDARRRSSRRASSLCLLVLSRLAELTLLLLNPLLSKLGSASDPAAAAIGLLPVGPSLSITSSVLILGSKGVAAVAAAGALLTATGAVGALCFASWSLADRFRGRSSIGSDQRLDH